MKATDKFVIYNPRRDSIDDLIGNETYQNSSYIIFRKDGIKVYVRDERLAVKAIWNVKYHFYDCDLHFFDRNACTITKSIYNPNSWTAYDLHNVIVGMAGNIRPWNRWKET